MLIENFNNFDLMSLTQPIYHINVSRHNYKMWTYTMWGIVS